MTFQEGLDQIFWENVDEKNLGYVWFLERTMERKKC